MPFNGGCPLASATRELAPSSRHAASVTAGLIAERALAKENRDIRMSKAEQKAAALPPKLTVPMIIFFLPVLFIAILSPAVIVTLGWN